MDLQYQDDAWANEIAQDSDNDSEDFHPQCWAPTCEGPGTFLDEFEVNHASATLPPMKEHPPQGVPRTCRTCHATFASGNKLHRHLEECGESRVHVVIPQTEDEGNPLLESEPAVMALDPNPTGKSRARDGQTDLVPTVPSQADLPCVKSTAPPPQLGLQGIHNWYYLKLSVKARRDGPLLEITPDTCAAYTLADRSFVENNFPDAVWAPLEKPVSTTGVGKDRVVSRELAYITLYIPSQRPTGEWVFALWKVRVFVLDKLSPNILLGMDMLAPQEVIIDIKKGKMVQPACKFVAAPISYRPKSSSATKTRKITSAAHVIVPAHAAKRVPIHVSRNSKLCEGQDYFFKAERTPPHQGTIYHGLIQKHTSHVLVRNDTNKPIRVCRRSP